MFIHVKIIGLFQNQFWIFFNIYLLVHVDRENSQCSCSDKSKTQYLTTFDSLMSEIHESWISLSIFKFALLSLLVIKFQILDWSRKFCNEFIDHEYIFI